MFRRLTFVVTGAGLVGLTGCISATAPPASDTLAKAYAPPGGSDLASLSIEGDALERTAVVRLTPDMTASRTLVRRSADGVVSWYGQVDRGSAPSQLVVLRATPRGTVGVVFEPERLVRVLYSTPELSRVVAYPRLAPPPDEDPVEDLADGRGIDSATVDEAEALKKALEMGNAPASNWCGGAGSPCAVEIKVFAGYSAEALAHAGTPHALCDNVGLAVDVANATFFNNRMSIELVQPVGNSGCKAVNYSETMKTYTLHLGAFLNAPVVASPPETVRSRMALLGADIGLLVVRGDVSHGRPSLCGLAQKLGAMTPDQAIAVVAFDCAFDYFTLAHEVGHLLGARHDSNCTTSSTCGFSDPTRSLMTIMGISGHIRVPYWSEYPTDRDGYNLGNLPRHNSKVTVLRGGARVARFR